MDLNGIKIGILGGGVSGEREISLLSAKEVYQALHNNNLKAVFIDVITDQKERVKETISSFGVDVAFIALHGKFGEDGKIQEILEELDIAYTGSRPQASYFAMDKVLSKELFIRTGVATPKFFIAEDIKIMPRQMCYPLVIKPHFSGSSLGISILRHSSGLKDALAKAFSYSEKAIIEDYIEGRELTVGILDERPLAVVEIIPKKGYFDFHAKYSDGGSDFVAPAQLKEAVYRRVQNTALAAHRALGCRHFSRVDIRLDKDSFPYVLEVNSIPGLTSHSLLPLSAKACGISFDKLIIRMLELALYAKKEIQAV